MLALARLALPYLLYPFFPYHRLPYPLRPCPCRRLYLPRRRGGQNPALALEKRRGQGQGAERARERQQERAQQGSSEEQSNDLPIAEPEDAPRSPRLPLLDQVLRQESSSRRPKRIVILLAARALT